MRDVSPTHEVLTNPSYLSLIFSHLRYDHVKDVRLVCQLWKFEATKLARPKTRVCVNETNLDAMLYATTILGLHLHVRWSPFLSLGMKTLIQKYSRYVKSLSWFVDNSGTLRVPGQPNKALHWDITNLKFPALVELHLAMSKNEDAQTSLDKIAKSILQNSFSLESLRIDVFNQEYQISDVILLLLELKLPKLTSLRFGKHVKMNSIDFYRIQLFQTKITSFTWESNIHNNFAQENQLKTPFLVPLNELVICASQALEIPKIVLHLKRLSVENLEFANFTLPIATQFPILEDLSFSLKPGYSWESWIPINMMPHLKLKSLKWLVTKAGEMGFPEDCIFRMCSKFPNLESLSVPANDRFIHVMCKHLKKLKRIEISGNCTDYGITGIPSEKLEIIIKNVAAGTLKKDQETLRFFRRQPNLCDLTGLEEIKLVNTKITDMAVIFGISVMPNIRKVYLTGVTLGAILQLLNLRNIIEIGVPQPSEGNISYEEIELLQKTTPHVKIIAGWDWNALQPSTR